MENTVRLLILTAILIRWLCPLSCAEAIDPNTSSALAPTAMIPLPLGQIHPDGWLANQLRIQADGLSGHLDEFWPDIAQSGWIGGDAEGWERGPYWLDGMVPLAYLLNDPVLKDKVRRWMDYIITHQQPDGWLGPVQSKDRQPYDPWPVFVILKAMMQYAQAENDPRVIPAMIRCTQKLHALLGEKPLFDWSAPRWGELLVSAWWLYDQHPDPQLLELAQMARQQGLDWPKHFADFQYKTKCTPQNITYYTHGVNNAMALKAYALWSRRSRDPADRNAVYDFLAILDQYHGQATGIFTCDEHYAGLSPSQGTELCTVVEFMYSMEMLLSVLGDPRFGDRLESVAFNNLPAAFKPDMWAHQFDQQANQVVCSGAGPAVYTINSADSNIFGLEPCYGCCTANYHQGWPKLAAHLWMKTPDGGLAAVAYAASTVKTLITGVPVQITLRTEYPFRDRLDLTVKTESPVRFPLSLRIPQWTRNPQLTIDNKSAPVPLPETFCRIKRLWEGTTRLTLRLPMPVQLQRRYNDSVAIRRGPLLYVLKIDGRWKLLKGDRPHADWELYPKSPWNYALSLDPENPEKSITFRENPIGDSPFTPEGAPVSAVVYGRQIPWPMESNAAAPPPQSPLDSPEPLEKLMLIPYGCSRLRITEFPLLTP
jgi:DUF1680 family protein